MTVSHPRQKKRFFIFTGLLTAAMLVLSACQTEPIPVTGLTPTPDPMAEATPPPAPAVEPTPVPTPVVQPDPSPTPEMVDADEAELSVADTPEFGEILVGNDGMTLYMFAIDGPNQSNCDEDCLMLWPPLLTEGSPMLGPGVDPALVGTAETVDGSLMVTYNDMPLYFWIQDQQPGDTNGQGVGGVWYVVSPEGEPIGMDEQDAMAATEEESAVEEGEMAEEEPDIEVAQNTRFGDILTGKDGMTLYMFLMDEENVSNCRGGCLSLWPPLVVEADEPVLGEGVDPDLIGTADLEGGRQVVTYNGMPLYYYAQDNREGDLNGQGVGSVWFVVSPEGEVVRQEVQSQSGSSDSSFGDYEDDYGYP
jgi:predicted lipoprotein with Yx(FWY)xxD motif